MMSMVERVARAIAACQQELGEDKWSYCLPEARAAIEEMREPTDAMLETAEIGDHEWRLAIDTALDEQPS